MRTHTLLILLVLISSHAQASIRISIDHLIPPNVYDNLGGVDMPVIGQTFIARDHSFSGVTVFIGDPTRNLPSVGPLLGPADLVLWDAADLEAPVELARETVVAEGQEVEGELIFLLDSAVSTVPGRKYFFAIEADDPYGLGLTNAYVSTFPDGAEGWVAEGRLQEHPNERDASFVVYTELDLDGDGFTVSQGDCDDADPLIHPGAVDLPGNLVDEDCDGSLDPCDPTAEWRNHGQFVRCVSHECDALVAAGQVDASICEMLVSQAARSDVGRP